MSFPELHPRLAREFETVNVMIEIYCKDKHAEYTKGHLCPSCEELQKYAYFRLQNCRFQENKPTCGNCPIHCYRKSKQKQIKEVMRYAGPKMIFKYPKLAIRHILDSRRKVELPIAN